MDPPKKLFSYNQYEKYFCEVCRLWIFLRQQSSHEKSKKHLNALQSYQRYRDKEKRQINQETQRRDAYLRQLNSQVTRDYIRDKDEEIQEHYGSSTMQSFLKRRDDNFADHKILYEQGNQQRHQLSQLGANRIEKEVKHLQSRKDSHRIGPQVPDKIPGPAQQDHSRNFPYSTSRGTSSMLMPSSRKFENKSRQNNQRRGKKQQNIPRNGGNKMHNSFLTSDYEKYYKMYSKQTERSLLEEKEVSLKNLAMEHARKDAEDLIRQELMKEFAESKASTNSNVNNDEIPSKNNFFTNLDEQQHSNTGEIHFTNENTLDAIITKDSQDDFIENAGNDSSSQELSGEGNDGEYDEEFDEHQEVDDQYIELDEEAAKQFFGEQGGEDLETDYYNDPSFFMSERATDYIRQQQKLEEADKQRQMELERLQEIEKEISRSKEEEKQRIQAEIDRQNEIRNQKMKDKQLGLHANTGYGSWEEVEVIEEITEETSSPSRESSLFRKENKYDITNDSNKRKRDEVLSTNKKPKIIDDFSMTFS